MKTNNSSSAGLILVPALCLTILGCQKPATPSSSIETAVAPAAKAIQIGGEDVVTLKRQKTGDDSQAQFLSATVLPGRGMNLFQVTAYVPGKGEVKILASPAIEEAAKLLTGEGDDTNGNQSFKFGGAFLVPFANRIVGKVSTDGKTVTTEWHGIPLTLVANWKGKNPGAVPHAMHGLILKSKATDVQTSPIEDGQQISGRIDAGDFDRHWFSKSDIAIIEQLTGKAVEATVTVKNVGDKPEPVGIGWHPYFALPSGDRTQARLHVPGDLRTDVNNYDDVFATGRLLPVKDTPYDFTGAGGRPLEKQFLDDNWTHVKRSADASSVSDIIDPAANYGVRIVAVSPEISAVQVYAPLDKSFVVLEPQFNLNDPFGREWKGIDTKMVMLKPGKTATWKVRLELFIPKPK